MTRGIRFLDEAHTCLQFWGLLDSVYNLIFLMAIQFFNRLETVDYLISSRTTGKPAHFAKRLGISERALYDFLAMMRELGAPIAYCKQCESYYYVERGGFHVRFKKASY